MCSRFPYPLEKGDKLRAYHQIKELSKSFDVTLICTSEHPIDHKHKAELNSFCKEIYIFRISKWGLLLQMIYGVFNQLPFQVLYFYRYKHHRNIQLILNNLKPDHVFCQLVRMSEYVKKEHLLPKTLDYMDSLSKGMERRIQTESWYKRWFFRMESERLKRYERAQFDYFDNKLIISKQDQQLIQHPENHKIRILPNGIDSIFFEQLSLEKSFDIVFTGNLSYPPNVEAACFLVENILPLLLKHQPHLKVLLSGANPSKRVIKLQSSHVCVTGWVQDIRESYQKSRVFVAPLFIGTGLQNKLLEAMASGLPCVTTALVNNSLGAKDNHSVLLADSAELFAKKIINLLNDNDLCSLISVNGKDYVFQNFSWEEQGEQLVKWIGI